MCKLLDQASVFDALFESKNEFLVLSLICWFGFTVVVVFVSQF